MNTRPLLFPAPYRTALHALLHWLLPLLLIVPGLHLQPALAAAPIASIYSELPSRDLAAETEFLEDPYGNLSIDDIRSPTYAARFQPAARERGDINFGYSTSVFWLRVIVASDDSGRHLLEVAFPSLDQVTLYAGTNKPQTSGDSEIFSHRPVPHRNLVFPLTLTANQPLVLYLRVKSQGTLTIPLTLWHPQAFESHNLNTYSALALYYGALAALFGYNLLLFFATRDRSFLEYVLFVVGMAIGQLSLNGFGNQFVWPEWPVWGNIALPIGFAMCGLFGAMFTRTLLNTRRVAPHMDKVVLLALGLFACNILLAPILPYRLLAAFVSFSGLFFSILAVIVGLRCLLRGAPGARFYLLAWSLLLIGVGTMAARNFGWLPTNPLTSYAMQIGSAFEMLLLSFALAERINTLQREKEAAQAEALTAHERMLNLLQKNEQELEARVSERTEALAKANATLEANHKLLQEMAHQDPLTGLANRLLLDAHLEHALQRARRHSETMALMLVDLDDFKPINDTYGHGVGDQLLREVAARLRASVREADLVARLGGDEFVIVLENLHSVDDALRVAEKLVKELALPFTTPFTTQSPSLTIGASVGIALFTGQTTTPTALIRQADIAMYTAKAAGRGRYHLYPL